MVGKAEQLPGLSNPRFVVTSLTSEAWSARALYEDLYCARGEMENRIKECQGTCSRIARRRPPCSATSCVCGCRRLPMSDMDALRRKHSPALSGSGNLRHAAFGDC